jgi:peptide deformylase
MRITTNKKDIEFKCDLVYFKEGQLIANKLIKTCLLGNNKDCIGLAHNQIKGDKKVFVAKIDKEWKSFINPEIIETSTDYIMHGESCMSFPNKFNKVKRYNWIDIKHQVRARSGANGPSFIIERYEGMNAIVIQHEIDHLNGIHIFNK